MDTWFHNALLATSTTHWTISVGAVVVSMLLFQWISHAVKQLLVSRLDMERHIWLSALTQSIYLPWLFFFWCLSITFVIEILTKQLFGVSLKSYANVVLIRQLLFLGALYWSLLRFIANMERKIAPRWSIAYMQDKTTVHAIAQLSRIVLTLVAALIVLSLFKIPMSGLLAFGGVGGLGAAFAAKETLSNFLGGMMIFLDRPFSVGDWILSPDRNIEGTVEQIGWRLTRLRTFDKRPLYVPNSIFSTISVENVSRMTNRRINTTIGVRYDDAGVIAKITADIDSLLRQHPAVDTLQTIMVNFTEFAASSLNINLYCFTKTTDWAKYRAERQDIFLKCIEIIARHGAECAFPTTTIYMEGETHVDIAGRGNHAS